MLVEEENSFITGRVGQRVRLRDPFMNGRPVLIEHADLQGAGTPESDQVTAQGIRQIHPPPKHLRSEHDKKGDEFFNINWSEITTEHVLTLLCCLRRNTTTLPAPTTSGQWLEKLKPARNHLTKSTY
ncbi:hypothetical protein [Escherichia coli]|uniref:hypothetical protein n=1 Tax=Escherichia coli TaxID=562 RepID=UPI003D9F49CF